MIEWCSKYSFKGQHKTYLMSLVGLYGLICLCVSNRKPTVGTVYFSSGYMSPNYAFWNWNAAVGAVTSAHLYNTGVLNLHLQLCGKARKATSSVHTTEAAVQTRRRTSAARLDSFVSKNMQPTSCVITPSEKTRHTFPYKYIYMKTPRSLASQLGWSPCGASWRATRT